MTIKALSPNLSVSPQLASSQIPGAASANGFRSIICNRPDGEEPGQPSCAEIESAAREAGLAFQHVPVWGKDFTPQAIAAFAEALETLPKPVLAFCRTGTRSAVLWALSNNGSLTADERIRTGARAGFDFEPWREQMEGDL